MSPRWRYPPSRRHSWPRRDECHLRGGMRHRDDTWAPMTSLADVARLLAAGDASPLEVLDACLSNLDAAQAHGAFVFVDEAGARRAANALPSRPRGPLHGIPVAVKD